MEEDTRPIDPKALGETASNPSWYVYIVLCADNSLYTGITTDYQRRLKQHNGFIAGGARFTRCRRPVNLLWLEPSPDHATAARREYQIKRLSRTRKLALVKHVPFTLQTCSTNDQCTS